MLDVVLIVRVPRAAPRRVQILVGERGSSHPREADMLRRRHAQPLDETAVAPAFAHFHEWVASLPWVVERPFCPETRTVRCFGVDCAPLGRRQVWLLTGMDRHLDPCGLGLAVIVPASTAAGIEESGLGWITAPMPQGCALMSVSSTSLADRGELEALVLAAYICALA
jgi:hypothetical protein